MVELVTPERAHADLRNGRPNNRKISRATVAGYVRAMQHGEWRSDNGVAIKYNQDGLLIDGQHRLSAVCEYGEPVEMLVAYNVPDEAMATIDYGRGRTIADLLTIESKTDHSVVVAAVARRVYAWKSGKFMQLSGFKFTPLDNRRVLGENPEIMDAVQFSRLPDMEQMRATLTTSSRAAFLSWLLRAVDREQAEDFLLKLSTGEGLRKLQPIYALREALLRSERAGRSRAAEWQQVYLVIAGWNHHRRGTECKLIKMPVGLLTNEQMPKPI
ncbi:hypothetical protein [Saccharothrix violaceirubra]|uniref:DGQHR domain-containing protein n=1 Tax=Saccharothrix violaceirubra TaxID=413306 RepID=A0A7W7SYH4_9PSEU|nr:hypothetical protein [Saccharothrix violaceirubra]MBB4963026.1 hypothetical protein [Saccharothrix violaceirubra]